MSIENIERIKQEVKDNGSHRCFTGRLSAKDEAEYRRNFDFVATIGGFTYFARTRREHDEKIF